MMKKVIGTEATTKWNIQSITYFTIPTNEKLQLADRNNSANNYSLFGAIVYNSEVRASRLHRGPRNF